MLNSVKILRSTDFRAIDAIHTKTVIATDTSPKLCTKQYKCTVWASFMCNRIFGSMLRFAGRMNSSMFRSSSYLQIVKTIIRRIFVYMMHYLTFEQRPAERSCHNRSVIKNHFIGFGMHFISVWISCTSPVGSSTGFYRTVSFISKIVRIAQPHSEKNSFAVPNSACHRSIILA